MNNTFKGLKGIKIGHAEDLNAKTGVTVFICEKGCTGGVDVRGAAPGTRETDLLDPTNLVDKVHAVVLSGGSAFGLDSMSGVMKYLEENKIGFDVGVTKVPIVTGAVLFDLLNGSHLVRPDLEMGYRACLNANDKDIIFGNIGAGAGATVGKIYGPNNASESGIGFHTIELKSGLIVSAVVAVNAYGDVFKNGEIIAGAKNNKGEFINTSMIMRDPIKSKVAAFKPVTQVISKNIKSKISNTTIGVILTNAKLSKAEANKVASMGHDGMARAIRPIHTMFDGDTLFTMATNKVKADTSLIGDLAAEAVEKAIYNAIELVK